MGVGRDDEDIPLDLVCTTAVGDSHASLHPSLHRRHHPRSSQSPTGGVVRG